MAQKTEQKAEQAQADKGPDFIAFHVREGERGKKYWTRLGAAWAHRDGAGFNIQLDVMPVTGFDGRIVLRVPEPKADKPEVATQDEGEGA
jgi:hypothetical protein